MEVRLTAIQTLKEEIVPLKSRIWVSAADGATATLNGLVAGGILTYYFTRWRGLEGDMAALVWLLFGIWNAVNDPLFGFISDRTKNKLGRRIPYIRYGAPIYSLAFICLWINWGGQSTSQMGLFFQLLFFLFVFDTLYTAIATSIYIMPFEMAISNKARSSILIWKILFNVFATAIPLILGPIILPGPGEDATSFRIIMISMGLAMGAIVFLSTFYYKEKHFIQEEEQFPFFKSLIACFKNPSFLVFESISFTIIYVQTGLMQGVLYYFDEINIPGVPIYLALAVGIIIGVLLWLNRRDKWGVKASMQIMTAMFAAGCFIMLFGGRLLPFAMISFFLVGTGFAGGMYLIPLMNGDVIDMDEHKTGLRREGMYAGINSFITKPAISLAQAAFLQILAWYGYDQTLAKGLQTTNAQTGILTAWMLIPGILLFACTLILSLYPLHGKEWENIKNSIARSHQEKEKNYLLEQGIQWVD
jgi:GPH family glycoside/pentoside/hexuronide:cation symporter